MQTKPSHMHRNAHFSPHSRVHPIILEGTPKLLKNEKESVSHATHSPLTKLEKK